MMENAKVAIFEDSEDWQALFGETVEDAGHTVVGRAISMPEAESLVDTLEEGSVDVAIVDGNLSRDVSGADGERIAGLLHQKFDGIMVIGASSSEDVRGADVNFSKVGDITDGIEQAIQAI